MNTLVCLLLLMVNNGTRSFSVTLIVLVENGAISDDARIEIDASIVLGRTCVAAGTVAIIRIYAVRYLETSILCINAATHR